MIRVDGKDYSWREQITVADLLRESECYDSCYLVQLNSEYIFKPDFDVTLVPDNSTIITIPIIAGG